MPLPPLGATLTSLVWLSTPDKYGGPERFDDLESARAHGPYPVISAEVILTTPDGVALELSGGVPSADTMWRDSPRQEPGVLPSLGARVVEQLESRQEAVFENPDGSRFVLIVT